MTIITNDVGKKKRKNSELGREEWTRDAHRRTRARKLSSERYRKKNSRLAVVSPLCFFCFLWSQSHACEKDVDKTQTPNGDSAHRLNWTHSSLTHRHTRRRRTRTTEERSGHEKKNKQWTETDKCRISPSGRTAGYNNLVRDHRRRRGMHSKLQPAGWLTTIERGRSVRTLRYHSYGVSSWPAGILILFTD